MKTVLKTIGENRIFDENSNNHSNETLTIKLEYIF